MNTRGTVLLFTLWILAAMSIIAVGFAHRVELERRATVFQMDMAQSYWTAKGGIYSARADLIAMRTVESSGVTTGNRTTLSRIDRGRVQRLMRPGAINETVGLTISIEDEEAKIQLNAFRLPIIRGAARLAGISPDTLFQVRSGSDGMLLTEDDRGIPIPDDLYFVTGERDGRGRLSTSELNQFLTTLPVAPPRSDERWFDRVNLNSASLRVRQILIGREAASDVYKPLLNPLAVFDTWVSVREALGPDQEDVMENLRQVFDFSTYTFTIRARSLSGTAVSTIRASYDFGPDGIDRDTWSLGVEPTLLSWREDI